MEQLVHRMVGYITKACFQVSRLLELQLQRLIVDQLTFPNINKPTWIRKLFLLVTNGQPEQSFGDAELDATYSSFKYTLGQYALQNIPMTSQIITYVVAQNSRNIILHIPSHYQAMSQRWVSQCLTIRGLPEQQARKIARLLCLQVFADEEGSESEVSLDQDPREDPDLEQYVPHIQTRNTGMENQVHCMYRDNYLFTSWDTK